LHLGARKQKQAWPLNKRVEKGLLPAASKESMVGERGLSKAMPSSKEAWGLYSYRKVC
jgi:hypothetical protein